MAKYSVSFTLPEKKVPFFEKAFEEKAEAFLWNLIEKGKNKGLLHAEAYFEEKPENVSEILEKVASEAGIETPVFEITKLEEKNWLEESFKSFPPVSFGRYYIYGSHIKEKPPADKIALQIDAATAFGSGEHATTQGCLQAFDLLLMKKEPKTILDMGCGSGILSMAAYKAMQNKPLIDAVDIDEESVRVTKQNAQINGTRMHVFQSNGYQKITSAYDLIFANILARPLIEMAPELMTHLKKGGVAILSGFLTHQKHWVQKAHEEAGLEVVSYHHIKEWGTLVVRRNIG